jgi:hypothetical protein
MRGAMPAGRKAGESLTPYLQEKPLWEDMRARTKTDTGGQAENAKVIEITLVKELGKIAP